MKNKIFVHLNTNPSYLKKGINFLTTFYANKYGSSERTVKSIVKSLEPRKREYLTNLKNQNQLSAAI